MSKSERRAAGFWRVLNDWWRNEKERTGKSPGMDAVTQ